MPQGARYDEGLKTLTSLDSGSRCRRALSWRCHSEPSRRLGEEPAVCLRSAKQQVPHRAFGPIRN